MTTVSIENNPLNENVEEKTYKCGDFFLIVGKDEDYSRAELHILAQTDCSVIHMVHVSSRNRLMQDPVKSNIHNVSHSDIVQYLQGYYTFIHVKDVKITVS